MAAAILSKDWSHTPLGPIETWPQSLRTTVSLCLASNFPISVAWGPERVQIYNDGYWPICAAKHPASMGQDFRECWFSAWEVIGEAFERAQRGQTSFLENQRMFLDRNGYLEETFFTFSFSPIRDESGGVGGLFHPVTETTARMLSERRTRALRDLAAAASKVRTAAEACKAISEVLSGLAFDIPFGCLYLFDGTGEEPALHEAFGLDGVPGADVWPLADAAGQTEPVLIADVAARLTGTRGGPYPECPNQAFVVPIPRAGAIVLGVSPRLPLDDAYQDFYQLLAAHLRTAFANAHAYEDERKKVEALAELDRAKTAFFNNVSHELRTPLTLMLAPLDEMLAGGGENAGLALIQRNGKRLLKLVNTLLDFSRIEAGRMRAICEPVDLSELTADIASAFRAPMDLAGLAFEVHCPALGEPVYVDREMWEKIVLNLLSNALKFTFAGRVRLDIRKVAGSVELSVEDSGTGIPVAELPRLFERFHRIQGARSRTHEGTGIGLALVDELAKLHGGTVAATSEPGIGSVFTVQLPLGRAHLADDQIVPARNQPDSGDKRSAYVIEATSWSQPGEVPATSGGSGGTVLLADDNADMRGYLTRVLSERYQVHTVANGAAALAHLQAGHPVDLVLTDVMMPELDGFGLLRNLRADPRTRAIPVILLSARAGEEARMEGIEAGADDYLIKPFTVRELMARVDTHIQMARVQRETAAQTASEERFRHMANSAPVLMWTSAPDKTVNWFNRQWLEFTGRAMDQETGDGWADNIHPDDYTARLHTYSAAFDARVPYSAEYRLGRRDGEWRDVIENAIPLYGPAGEFFGFVGSCMDVTERKDTEKALEESEERFRAIVETLPNLIRTGRSDGSCDYVSQRWVDYTGRAKEDLVEDGWLDSVHPDDRAYVKAAWGQSANQQLVDVEFRIRRADGVYRAYRCRGVPLRDAAGKITRWFIANTDIQDYKDSEQKLAAQVGRLHLLDQITRAIGERQDLRSICQVAIRAIEENLAIDFACVCLCDETRENLTVTCVGTGSEALAMELALSGGAHVDVDGNGLSQCLAGQLVHEPDISASVFPFPMRLAAAGLNAVVFAPLASESQVFGVMIAARRAANSFSSGDCEFIRQLSGHVALASHQAQIYAALQGAYDELQQTQEAAMQQERLRALGQMASGIAHDINNALSPVALYTDSLLEKEPDLSPRTRSYLETTQRAIEDVSHTVGRLREFSRKREPQLLFLPVDLNLLAGQVLDLTRARWVDMPLQRGIVISSVTELAEALPLVPGNESEIREALTNLVFNAVDAMTEGGSLTLRTRVAGERVLVEVSDTGIGMDEETRRRCLEPFFTTKGERGTGLGLAMVYGVAQRQNALVEIDSEPGRGTTMRLSFPIAGDIAEAVAESRPLMPRRLRILIVDDDPLILRSLREALEGDGHAVTAATGGRDGIAAFEISMGASERFDVVFTDLGMPYIDGRRVAAAVKSASSQTPVVLLTGWGQRLMAEDEVIPNVDRVLSKPPKLRDIRKALTEIVPGAVARSANP